MKSQLLAGAIALVVALPIGYNIRRGQQEKRRLIQTQIAQVRSAHEVQADITAALRQIEQYRKRLPPEPNPSWLVNEAVTLGEQAGLQLTTIAQDPPQTFQTFTRLAVSLEFAASYHQLGMFLDRVEHAEHFIHVERLSVTPPREEWGKATIQLTLSTVYLPPVQQQSGG